MIKNKRGISLIEVIVSIGLISIVLVLIFRLLADVRNEETLTKYKASNLINQSLVVKAVQDDMLNDTLQRVDYCSELNGCIKFTFTGSTKILKFDTDFVYYGTEGGAFESWSFHNSEIGNTTPNMNIYNRYYTDAAMGYLRIVIPVVDTFNKYRYDIEVFFTYKGNTVIIAI